MAAPISNIDLAYGNLGQRGLKIFVERVGDRVGDRASASRISDGIWDMLTAQFPALIANPGIFEAAHVAAGMLVQDPGVWRLIAGLFGLSPEHARELTNEGIDAGIASYLDGIKRLRTRSVKDQNRELERSADATIDGIRAQIARKHPELVEEVLLDRGRFTVMHRKECSEVRSKPTVLTGLTAFQAIQLGGRWAIQCSGCTIGDGAFRGTLSEVLPRCASHIRASLNALLMHDSLKAQRQQVLDAGEKKRDLTVEQISNVVDVPDIDLQRGKLLAILGVAPAAPKNAVTKFLDRAKKAGENLLDDNSPDRKKFRKGLKARNKATQDDIKFLRGGR